jgi:hypothetical protein
MSVTLTPNLGLGKADPNDLYDVLLVNSNLDILDTAYAAAAAGSNLSVITSSTRPGSPIANRFYWETDTRRLYLYTGGAWVQIAGPTLPVALTTGTTIPTNCALGRRFRGTMTQNGTLSVPTNAVDGMDVVWELTASGGPWTLSLSSGVGGFVFSSDVTALTPIESGKTDILGGTYHGPTQRWRVMSYAKGFTAS